MKKYSYIPTGVCSRAINFEIDDNGIITALSFDGGCPGNTTGVAALALNRRATEVADLLRTTDCRGRGTSCPDQLAKALDSALNGTLQPL